MNVSPTSFPEIADIETSSEGYASRFSGAVGIWMLEVQSCAVLELLKGGPIRSVLELGGGHAQLAKPLLAQGYELTVAASSEECQARLEAVLHEPRFNFKVANLVQLPFADRSYDAVVSVRFISHCEQWQKLVSEMCRVARSAVLIDYPRKSGFNLLYAPLFALKHRAEGNTREYRSFSTTELDLEFGKSGFVRSGSIGQFVLPMVFHRVLKHASVSGFLERLLRSLGLSKFFGTPVLVRYVRTPS